MIEIGDKVRFKPCLFFDRNQRETSGGFAEITEVTGTVIYINAEHLFYRAEYEMNGNILYECFKFE